MKKQLALIGDVHEKIAEFNKIRSFIRKKEPIPIIQLGDFGFDEAHHWAKNNLCADEKVLFGNHDDYKQINEKHSLGNFGYIKQYDLFYVRGAYSIDKVKRKSYIDWYPEEELSYGQMNDAFKLYMDKKPSFLISHDCSDIVRQHMFGDGESTATSYFLEQLIDAHAPDIHVFGHHHVNKFAKVGKTSYICLGENQYMIFEF